MRFYCWPARLGLRVSDIVSLRLEQIRWDHARLDVVQTKTGDLLTLPLTEEVGQALIDYLQHGRPVTPYREVFLRLHAPVAPLSIRTCLHDLITFYRRRARIARPGGAPAWPAFLAPFHGHASARSGHSPRSD